MQIISEKPVVNWKPGIYLKSVIPTSGNHCHTLVKTIDVCPAEEQNIKPPPIMNKTDAGLTLEHSLKSEILKACQRNSERKNCQFKTRNG